VALSAVITEGKKAQQVVFTFPDVGASSLLAPSTDPRREPQLVHPWARPVAGGFLAGAVVAAGVGAVLGGIAIGKKSEAHCDATNVCDDAPLSSARDAAHGATVAFTVAGALAVGSVVTFLAFGRTRVQATASFNHAQLRATW
jgi:hypothetical protein